METTTNKTIHSSFALRRVGSPYLGLTIIVLLVIIMWIPYMLRTHDWSPLEGVGLAAVFLGIFVLFGMSYRIWWRDDAVVRRTAGIRGLYTTIKVWDIQRIEKEISDLRTLVTMRRPFRRIVIYGKTEEGPGKIDVSLKHFKTDDIRKLMKVIHERRPDLSIPEGWATV